MLIAAGDRPSVLALDGGGIRGLVNARLLQHLEAELRRPCQQLFSVIAGTSTGALLAAGLARPLGSREHHGRAGLFADAYRAAARDIFPTRRTRSRIVASVTQRPTKSTALETLLRTYVQDAPLADTAVEVVIPAYDPVDRHPVIFTREEARRGQAVGVSLADAAAASAAAPTYLASVPVVWGGGSRRLIDGGVFANNPTLLTILGLLANGADHVRVLSLGTGRGRLARAWAVTADDARDPRNFRLLAGGAIETLMDAGGQFAGAAASWLSNCEIKRVEYDFHDAVPALDDARDTTLNRLLDMADETWARERQALLDWIARN